MLKVRSGWRSGVLFLATLAWSGCGGGGEAPADAAQDLSPAAVPMSATVQELVDQGNDAQREGRYEEALGFYRQAMAEDPEHPVPQFGALMVALATGQSALADTLSGKLTQTAPELLAMLNTDGSMGGDPHSGGMPGAPALDESALSGGMPSGHPSVQTVPPDTLRPDTSGIR